MSSHVIKIASYSQHIDNGGVNFEFTVLRQEDKNGEVFEVPMVAIGAQYFGYPSLSATLSGMDLGPDDFDKIGDAFKRFADSLRERQLRRDW